MGREFRSGKGVYQKKGRLKVRRDLSSGKANS